MVHIATSVILITTLHTKYDTAGFVGVEFLTCLIKELLKYILQVTVMLVLHFVLVGHPLVLVGLSLCLSWPFSCFSWPFSLFKLAIHLSVLVGLSSLCFRWPFSLL